MTVEQTRQLGRALMAVSVVQLLLFLVGASRRSYAALAIPVFAGIALASGLAFWVGYTMAASQGDEEQFDPAPAEPPLPRPDMPEPSPHGPVAPI